MDHCSWSHWPTKAQCTGEPDQPNDPGGPRSPDGGPPHEGPGSAGHVLRGGTGGGAGRGERRPVNRTPFLWTPSSLQWRVTRKVTMAK
jgi:hypothetical protein